MSLRIATWNVNSLRQRLDHLARFAEERSPDILCLQETKVTNEAFPEDFVRNLGFEFLSVHGQKSYNGVAILSRVPFEPLERRIWCEKNDCRHLAVSLSDGLEIHNFYVPSGGPTPDPDENEKFAHKLRFLTEMADWASSGNVKNKRVVVLGDLNVAPLEWDVWNHKKLLRSVGHTPTESAHMERLMAAADFIDVPRHFTPPPTPLYSWWGYRYPQAFAKDYGWRLDHILATPKLISGIRSLTTCKETRSWDKPSDHVPLVLELD